MFRWQACRRCDTPLFGCDRIIYSGVFLWFCRLPKPGKKHSTHRTKAITTSLRIFRPFWLNCEAVLREGADLLLKSISTLPSDAISILQKGNDKTKHQISSGGFAACCENWNCADKWDGQTTNNCSSLKLDRVHKLRFANAWIESMLQNRRQFFSQATPPWNKRDFENTKKGVRSNLTVTRTESLNVNKQTVIPSQCGSGCRSMINHVCTQSLRAYSVTHPTTTQKRP